ncbi:MAG: RNA methyltransferase [Chitinophagaceae bacterium]|nr:RNA methyltransferase [Chitinophagaceae bacterium]
MSSPSPVLGVVGIPDTNDIVGKRFFLLDQIRDPGNLGTIIRIADWFGLDGIICSPETVELYNPKVVQASMGSIFRVPVIYTTLPDWIRTHADIPVYAASLQGKNLHESSHSIQTGAILIGNESNGLTPELLSASTYQIRIPGGGAAESLNAAVAAGILAYGLLY